MAVVVTVALVPVATAYLQLGYGASEQLPSRSDDASSVAQVLERAVAETESGVAGDYRWPARRAMVSGVRARLSGTITGVETADSSRTVAVQVAYNRTLADRVASTACPGGGPGRRFGPCVADRGVVVQQRAGESVLVAVAFDVTVTTPDQQRRITRVVRP